MEKSERIKRSDIAARPMKFSLMNQSEKAMKLSKIVMFVANQTLFITLESMDDGTAGPLRKINE